MSKGNLKSVHGRHLGITKDGEVVAKDGFVSGGWGGPSVVLPGANTAAVFDDFLRAVTTDTGTLFPPRDAFKLGFTDTGQLRPATGVVASTNGVFRMTSSATSTQTPTGSTMTLSSDRQWKANQGGLRMGARIKISALSGENVFVGLTDTGGAELPVYDTGAAASETITPAADYVGFLYTGAPAAAALGRDTWRAVAGKAGTDQVVATGQSPTANVYQALEVEVSKDGNVANFFINGIPVAQINGDAITATTALAAQVGHANTEATAVAVDVDWMNPSAFRDTGN
jgi:hypothetical protein